MTKDQTSTLKARLIVVAAPSGGGKSSFLERILKESDCFADVITYTTRSIRRGETQGVQYHYINHADFLAKIDNGFFAEWAKVHTNLYGTSRASLEDIWKSGKVAIMDIDVQGVATLKIQYPDAVTIFILPPSIEELRRRIIKRDGKVPEDIETRLTTASREMELANQFDFRVTNDNFERSFAEFKKVVEGLV